MPSMMTLCCSCVVSRASLHKRVLLRTRQPPQQAVRLLGPAGRAYKTPMVLLLRLTLSRKKGWLHTTSAVGVLMGWMETSGHGVGGKNCPESLPPMVAFLSPQIHCNRSRFRCVLVCCARGAVGLRRLLGQYIRSKPM